MGSNKEYVRSFKIYAIATDPVYIGTGGYTIGRVDNTIVRDPITKIPKIPGSSIAGTWRYYVALKLQSYFKDEYRINKKERKNVENIEDLFELNNKNEETKKWILFEGNRFAGIKCAGQDDKSNQDLPEDIEKATGHCGHCIVCKAFGFSKKDISWQGMIYFSDLNILLFPVYTRCGVKWITSQKILEEAGIKCEKIPNANEVLTKDGNEGHINLGWLYLKVRGTHDLENSSIPQIDGIHIDVNDIIIVPDSLISQIINSNLEVRTSVSIDPITGAAKEGALFTSEAIPRGTVFYGTIRIFDKSPFEKMDDEKVKKLKPLPSSKMIKNALDDSKAFFETLGIGGMTTRGFGRITIEFKENDNKAEGGSNGES